MPLCVRFHREIAKGAEEIWNWVCNEKRSDPHIFTLQIETKDRKRGQKGFGLCHNTCGMKYVGESNQETATPKRCEE